MKDLALSAKENAIREKNDIIKDLEKKVKNVNSLAEKLNMQIKEKDENIATIANLSIQSESSQPKCKECGKIFNTNMELTDHIVEHTYTVMVLRSEVNNLIDEKAKHKKICDFAWYCLVLSTQT